MWHSPDDSIQYWGYQLLKRCLENTYDYCHICQGAVCSFQSYAVIAVVMCILEQGQNERLCWHKSAFDITYFIDTFSKMLHVNNCVKCQIVSKDVLTKTLS